MTEKTTTTECIWRKGRKQRIVESKESHNARWIATKSKTCVKCGTRQPTENFGTATNRAGKFYYLSRCRPCACLYNKAYWERLKKERGEIATLDLIKDRTLRRKYGISLAEKTAMESRQFGACLICKAANQKLHVDHCHTSKKIRGLLCSHCNRAIGLFRDNPDVIFAAAEYVRKHQ